MTCCSFGQCLEYVFPFLEYDWLLRLCDSSLCPVDGEWSVWQHWSQCTYTCGGGTQYRTRVCNGPYNGGKPCEGKTLEAAMCNGEPCPPGKNMYDYL